MVLQAWLTGIGDAVQRLRPYLLDLLGAAGLVLLGSILGRLFESWSRRAAHATLERVGRRGAGAAAVGAAHLGEPVPVLVGRFFYWLVFLIFIAAAIEMLGLPVVSTSVQRLASQLPNVVSGLVIVFVGVVVASLGGGVAAATAASAGLRYAGAVGRAAQVTLLLLAVLLGLEQIGIHGELVVAMLAVLVGTVLGGAALAFGLGARTAVSNIVGSYYVAQAYRVGQTVRVGDIEGRIVRTTATAVILDTARGQVQVPAGVFNEQPSVLVTEAS